VQEVHSLREEVKTSAEISSTQYAKLLKALKIERPDFIHDTRMHTGFIMGFAALLLLMAVLPGSWSLLSIGSIKSASGAAGVLNMHRVQGQTTPHAITVLSEGDRMLNSQSLAYVLISRARDGLTLFVDDKERVIQQIERNDGKAPHATEIKEDAVQAKEAQALKPELPPLGIDNALREKLAALSKEADSTNTLPVRQKQLGLEL
jgi:hypothetical protein